MKVTPGLAASPVDALLGALERVVQGESGAPVEARGGFLAALGAAVQSPAVALEPAGEKPAAATPGKEPRPKQPSAGEPVAEAKAAAAVVVKSKIVLPESQGDESADAAAPLVVSSTPAARQSICIVPTVVSGSEHGKSVLPPINPTSNQGKSVLPPINPLSDQGKSVLPPIVSTSDQGKSVLPPIKPTTQQGASVLPPVHATSDQGKSVLPPINTTTDRGTCVLPPVDSEERDAPASATPGEMNLSSGSPVIVRVGVRIDAKSGMPSATKPQDAVVAPEQNGVARADVHLQAAGTKSQSTKDPGHATPAVRATATALKPGHVVPPATSNHSDIDSESVVPAPVRSVSAGEANSGWLETPVAAQPTPNPQSAAPTPSVKAGSVAPQPRVSTRHGAVPMPTQRAAAALVQDDSTETGAPVRDQEVTANPIPAVAGASVDLIRQAAVWLGQVQGATRTPAVTPSPDQAAAARASTVSAGDPVARTAPSDRAPERATTVVPRSTFDPFNRAAMMAATRTTDTRSPLTLHPVSPGQDQASAIPDDVITAFVKGSDPTGTPPKMDRRPAAAASATQAPTAGPAVAETGAKASTESAPVVTPRSDPSSLSASASATITSAQRAAIAAPLPRRESAAPAGLAKDSPPEQVSTAPAIADVRAASPRSDPDSSHDAESGRSKREELSGSGREAASIRSSVAAPLSSVPAQPVPVTVSAATPIAVAPVHRALTEPVAQPVAPDRVTLKLPDADGNSTTVRIAVRGDQVRTTIVTSDAMASQQLTAQAPELERALASHGFHEAAVSVSAADPVPVRGGDNQGTSIAAAMSSSGGEATRGHSRHSEGTGGESRQGSADRDRESPDRTSEERPRQGRSHQRARQGRAR